MTKRKMTAVERDRRRYEREQREADFYRRVNAGPLTVHRWDATTAPPAPRTPPRRPPCTR